MAKVVAEHAEVNARILYWGVDDAGKRTSLQSAATKLRPDNRGRIVETPTRLDPSVSYTVLPIELGAIGGMRTRIELIAVPGGRAHATTRKQLLDQVDGVVLVIDAQQSRIDENAAMLDELRKSLQDYARRLEEMPLVVQYNKRDLSDAYVIDELHRRLGLGSATVFETVATTSSGVLQALSTISKKVIRSLREQSLGRGAGATPIRQTSLVEPAPEPIEPEPMEPEPIALPDPEPIAQYEPEPEPDLDPDADLELDPEPRSPALELEEAILAEAEAPDAAAEAEADAARSVLEQPWSQPDDLVDVPLGPRLGAGLSIVSVGEATRADDRTVRVPVVLGDRDGETATVVLSIRLDPLIDGAR